MNETELLVEVNRAYERASAAFKTDVKADRTPTAFTNGVLRALIGFTVRLSAQALRRSLALEAHIAALEARLAEAEARRAMSFCGPHDPDGSYKQGDCVQRSGALYVATKDTDQTPGDSNDWRKIGVCR